MALIELQGVKKYYEMGSQVVKALDGINIAINKNDYLAFIGSSGSGKSTMLNILGCLDKPTSGQYHLNDKNVEILDQNELSGIRNLEIGFIFQSFNLLPRANALDNVMQPLIYRSVGFKKRKEMAMEAMSRVGLADRVDHLPNQLSGGQRQRIALARAIIKDARILVLDEATSALDSEVEAAIQESLETVMAGKTVFAIAPRLSTISHMDRIVVMNEGRIIEEGTHKTLLRKRGVYANFWERQSGGFLGVDAAA